MVSNLGWEAALVKGGKKKTPQKKPKKKKTYNLNFDRHLPECEPWNKNEDGHEHREPQLLSVEQGVGIVPPDSELDVVGVTQDDKDPSRSEAKPTNEAVVTLKDVVVVTKGGC